MAETRVLVVEDSQVVALDIEQCLVNLGYQVAGIVKSGEEALKVVEREKPALVLMDIVLSGTMDGIEAATMIRNRFRIPVIYLTAFSDEAFLKRASISDPFGYLIKPPQEKELRITIEMALHKHRLESRLQEKEEWLSAVLKSIGDAVVTTNTRGQVTFMNPVAEELTGWKQSEALGRDLKEVFYLDTRQENEDVSEKMPGERQRTRTKDNQGILISRSEIQVPVETTAQPIKNETGHIQGMVIVFRDISQRLMYEEKIHHQACHDTLTDLPNRALFRDRLNQALARSQRTGEQGAVLFVDLDNFKQVNDTLGHDTGDQLLLAMTERLKECMRKGDTVARMGGDEFTFILPGIKEQSDIERAGERILKNLTKPFLLNGKELLMTASIGVSRYPEDGNDAQTLMKKADTAMYQAKEKGRNRYEFFTS